jgi:hypothetical protein
MLPAQPTPEDLATTAPTQIANFPQASYEYGMIQIPPNIHLSTNRNDGQEAARYLQNIVNEWAAKGWEFFRVDTVGVYTPPGCLASLLGAQASYVQHYVVTFRRQIQRSA